MGTAGVIVLWILIGVTSGLLMGYYSLNRGWNNKRKFPSYLMCRLFQNNLPLAILIVAAWPITYPVMLVKSFPKLWKDFKEEWEKGV